MSHLKERLSLYKLSINSILLEDGGVFKATYEEPPLVQGIPPNAILNLEEVALDALADEALEELPLPADFGLAE